MKIALAQIDTLIGDIEGNAQRIREATERARSKGAELVVFPELTISGYDPRDLLQMPSFLARCERALLDLAKPAGWSSGIALAVGSPLPNREGAGAPAHNACVLIEGGEIRAVARKSLLPSYDVLEEHRHFEPSSEVCVTTLSGMTVGLSVCEDIWSSPRFHGRRRHKRDPVSEMTAAGADLLLNISASPFHAEKPSFRERMLESLASGHGIQIVMTNLVGGNDGTVFDGSSLALAADGHTVVRCLSFEEDLRIFDTSAASSTHSGEPRAGDDLDDVHRAIVLGIRDYCRKTGFKGAVLGLSGGIDSAVVAALAVDALGPEHVLALAMPSRYSSPGSLSDARLLAGNLGIELQEISIEQPFGAVLEQLEPHLWPEGAAIDLAHENIQPRLRAVYAMAFSNARGALLLACGNKSEIAVGYSTLYGDMAGGLSPLGDVLKTQVYALAQRINEKAGRSLIPASIIDKAPSAELAPGQRDEDSLPPYRVLDPIVRAFVEEGLCAEEIAERGHDRETAERVVGMITRAEYKRRQGPPVLKVSSSPFVSGYRLPMAAKIQP
ncbi:MAG: NAD+ synthase [Myxococcota bacterium]